MAKHTNRLTSRGITALSVKGYYSDGDGLYLVVDKSGAKRWSYIFQWDGRRKEMGLGGLSYISLAKARQSAAEQRRKLSEGINPIDSRRASLEAPVAVYKDFGTYSQELIEDIQSEFKNAKHIGQWKSTLRTHAAYLADKKLKDINTADILSVLKPLWKTHPETASRVRGRIERVLDAAKAQGLREGENPARWRGHLDNLLPKRQKLTRGHHAAMQYENVPEFMKVLVSNLSLSSKALQWTILSAARTGETLGATWSEIDLRERIWTIPATRMKAGRPHRVPITDNMLEILDTIRLNSDEEDYVFRGSKANSGLSNMSMSMLLRRLDVLEVTVHGFRSSFRDWAAEETDTASEVAEAALAHIVGDATERAYRRGDALAKRKQLMNQWNAYCMSFTCSEG